MSLAPGSAGREQPSAPQRGQHERLPVQDAQRKAATAARPGHDDLRDRIARERDQGRDGRVDDRQFPSRRESAGRGARGLRVGLFRPVTLWPFPSKRLAELAQGIHRMLVVEMNAGQMVEDVRLAVNGQAQVEFYGRTGGAVPMPDEILERIEAVALAPSPGLGEFVQNGHVSPIFIN